MIDDAFGHWLAGFIDGEAYFSIHRSNAHKGRDDYRFAFGLQLRADDRAILEEIVERTGIGMLQEIAPRRRSYANTEACVLWRAGAQADIAKLVELLDRYPLRTRRAQLYAVWREAFTTARGDWPRLGEYASRLAAMRAFMGMEMQPTVERDAEAALEHTAASGGTA